MTTIGVTGHRLLTDLDRLSAGLDEVAGRLEACYPTPWTVVTSAAEGADRLVAHRLLQRPGSRLVVVLPMPRERYVEDFTTAASRADFDGMLARADEVIGLPGEDSRDLSYEAAGQEVLGLSDVLVAVWDGLAEQGPGGTGGLVARARERSLPLAWLHAGNRLPGTREPTSLGADQGRVTFERLPGSSSPGPARPDDGAGDAGRPGPSPRPDVRRRGRRPPPGVG